MRTKELESVTFFSLGSSELLPLHYIFILTPAHPLSLVTRLSPAFSASCWDKDKKSV